MKNKMRSIRGITLVSLIITIIILLVLAGITIGTLVGSGLFEKAKYARDEYINAQEKEQEFLNSIDIDGEVASTRTTDSERITELEREIAELKAIVGTKNANAPDIQTQINNLSSKLPTDYSTEEKIVGTWNDGTTTQTLYQKTWIGTTPTTGYGENNEVTLFELDEEIETIRNIFTNYNYRSSGSNAISDFCTDITNHAVAWAENRNVYFITTNGDLKGASYSITLQYTK